MTDPLARGDVAVLVLPEAAPALDGLRAHTPEQVPVGLAQVADAAAVAPADVVLVTAPCQVTDGWLDGLRAAAYSGVEVATAGALMVDAAGDLDAAAPGSGLTPRHPRLTVPSGPCLYVRRSAIELAGAPDAGFARRCLEAGLAHVLADDVLVVGSAGRAPREPGVLAALDRARRAVGPLRVVVDARVLGGRRDGTRVHVLELLGALIRSGEVVVTALVPEAIDAETHAALDRMPGLARVPLAAGAPVPPAVRADVVHRPFQVAADADLALLGTIAERLVITQQDLIGFSNPAYFASTEAWEGYRAMTARALRAADRVLFFSAHVRDEAVALELVETHRATVVALGVDHMVTGSPPAPSMPAGAQALPGDAETILCLGADYRHKNRVFALALVQALQREHGWTGRLVLAGPHITFGSSRPRERALLAADPKLAAAVLELGQVTEAEKEWLLQRAALVLYPTVHEGFGLIPFEAAAHGRPCLWAPGTALAELLGPEAAGLVAWDAGAGAGRALELMRDPELSAANRAAISTAAQGLRWDAAAAQLIAAYRAVCDQPASPVGRLERRQGVMSEGLSDDAIRLVGPGGALPAELERPLLALATHRRLGAPVLRAIRAGYQLARRLSGARSRRYGGGR